MTNHELKQLLQRASRQSFLEAIEIIYENEAQYKKSAFFKKTRIPLLQLYQNFYSWEKAEFNILDELKHELENFDVQKIVDFAAKAVEAINESPEISEKIKDFLDGFNLQALDGLLVDIQEELSKTKN